VCSWVSRGRQTPPSPLLTEAFAPWTTREIPFDISLTGTARSASIVVCVRVCVCVCACVCVRVRVCCVCLLGFCLSCWLALQNLMGPPSRDTEYAELCELLGKSAPAALTPTPNPMPVDAAGRDISSFSPTDPSSSSSQWGTQVILSGVFGVGAAASAAGANRPQKKTTTATTTTSATGKMIRERPTASNKRTHQKGWAGFSGGSASSASASGDDGGEDPPRRGGGGGGGGGKEHDGGSITTETEMILRFVCVCVCVPAQVHTYICM